MSLYTIGSICIKLKGRDAQNRCVIVDTISKDRVLVTGPKKLTGVRRRPVSITHLELTFERIDIKKVNSR